MSRQFVMIDLAEQNYCIPIEFVSGVIDNFTLTIVPNSLSFLKGVSNVRGDILPVIDLKNLFNLKDNNGGSQKLMCINLNGQGVALTVDGASNVISVEDNLINELPPLLYKSERNYFKLVANVNDNLTIIIDPDGLFTEEEKKEIFSLKDKNDEKEKEDEEDNENENKEDEDK